MNFSRVPKWVWWVGGAAVLLIILFIPIKPVTVTVDLPALIPPPPK